MWSSQETLPLEILEKIIMHLDITSLRAARQVCDYWRTVAEQRIEQSNYIFLEGNIEVRKEQLIPESTDVSRILFVGNGLVVLEIRQMEESSLETIRVFDESGKRTWEVELSAIIPGEGDGRRRRIDATATEEIVIIRRMGGSVGIWSRNGEYVTTVEDYIDFRASDSCLLFLHQNSQFSSINVKENHAVEYVKYSNSGNKTTIGELEDFCSPCALVSMENYSGLDTTGKKFSSGRFQVIGFNKKKKETFMVSPEIQIYREVYTTRIATPFIFYVGSESNRYDVEVDYDVDPITEYALIIFDFDGNKLFHIKYTSVLEFEDNLPPPPGWLNGYSQLKVDIRMESKTLFYRMGHSLVIRNLDTLMEKYTEYTKLQSKSFRQWWNSPESFRQINLKYLNCHTQSSYFVDTSSINFFDVDSPKNITKLCFSL